MRPCSGTRVDDGDEGCPRACLGVAARFRVARAPWRRRAVAMARDYVLPDDVKALAIPALAHRVLAKDARRAARPAGGVIARLLEEVLIPLHATRGA